MMVGFLTVVALLCCLGILFLGFMMARNAAVSSFQERLLEQVNHLAQQDVERGREWRWRYDEFRRVPYERKLWRFWVPLKPENFYADTAFLQETKS